MPAAAHNDVGFDNELSAFVWRHKYRDAEAREETIGATWRRVAEAIASVEASRSHWRAKFRRMFSGFRFLPAGRILASAGTGLDATLFNCFVMGSIDDSIAGIFERLRESALTMQLGGGIGCDFSTLRPMGSNAVASGRTASGPVSFLRLWDAMCATVLAGGNRRGAMMGTLRCDHPDIIQFIDAKRTPGALRNFNLSVLISDDFMGAIDDDCEIELHFPCVGGGAKHGPTGTAQGLDRAGRSSGCWGTLPAARVWRHLLDAAYDTAEPGVLFIDRINALNNLHYRERISTTNPCGEVPLPPFGACNLGSINLAAHVVAPFSSRARLDLSAIGRLARDAVRFLDDVIDVSSFPLAAQTAEARATRRIGLGITGLADALIMLGRRYDSDSGRALAREALERIRDEAYAASISLAEEKGRFPAFDADAYLAGKYISALPSHLRDGIARHGIRNSHLLAIAPAGSISILANNVSSGIEPVFAPRMQRPVFGAPGASRTHVAIDRAYALWVRTHTRSGSLPPAYVCAREIAPRDHLLMAAALQPLVDSSISKTVNVARTISRENFHGIYRWAFDLGLKGCTVFRQNPLTGEVLVETRAPPGLYCCLPERDGE